ncbi:1-acyl-sn-glycerol-3-phosphate acyltransferase [Formosimonas limnophila]|uniref:1-acyl-sn-glycerol-3-phosphate acyltransferase n=2 Tax=Formosimonas limnophila TaxID=1384487 RepID=A0A8J3CLX2_9BURK|nr:1-acyl-sn-glycerol-3-phosphate acyltransferase [Formosimonas limnophila]
MAALRSALFIVLSSLWTIFYAFVCMATAILPYRWRYTITGGWNRGVIFMARWIVGIDYKVLGRENLPPPNTGAIVLAKHQSAWETIYLMYGLGNPLCFVFKRELLWIPFFGWGIGLLRMVAINRKAGQDAYTQMENQARVRLNSGVWMILFPEGTRIPVGKKGNYKTGGTRLSVGLNAPIIPIAHNAGYCWPKHSWIKQPGTIVVSIGPAIYPNGRGMTAVHQEMETWIENEAARLPQAR